MRWLRRKGAMVPDPTPDAADTFDFTDEERAHFKRLEKAMQSNPALQKKVVKRLRKMERARGMAPTLKEKR